MHLRRMFFLFVAEHFRLVMKAVHLSWRENTRVDSLSENNLSCFLQATPGTGKVPVQTPSQLLMLLVEEQPDWISPRWMEVFATCIRQA